MCNVVNSMHRKYRKIATFTRWKQHFVRSHDLLFHSFSYMRYPTDFVYAITQLWTVWWNQTSVVQLKILVGILPWTRHIRDRYCIIHWALSKTVTTKFHWIAFIRVLLMIIQYWTVFCCPARDSYGCHQWKVIFKQCLNCPAMDLYGC